MGGSNNKKDGDGADVIDLKMRRVEDRNMSDLVPIEEPEEDTTFAPLERGVSDLVDLEPPVELTMPQPSSPPSDFAASQDLTVDPNPGATQYAPVEPDIIVEPPTGGQGTVLVVSTDPWAMSILAGRKVDVIAGTGIDSALALASQVAPSVMLLGLELQDGNALDLLDVLASRHAPFEAVVILRPDQWSYAGVVLDAGAAEVVEHGDTEHLLSVLASLAAVDRSTEKRAELKVPIRVQVAGHSWKLETVDLRATGIAVAGVPPLQRGSTVLMTLSLLGRRLELMGQLTRTWDNRGVSCGAFRFVGLTGEQREFLRSSVAEYGGHKVEDALVHSWRREIRSIVGTFDPGAGQKKKKSSLVHTHGSVISAEQDDDAPLQKLPGWRTGTIDFELPLEQKLQKGVGFALLLVAVGILGLGLYHLVMALLTG